MFPASTAPASARTSEHQTPYTPVTYRSQAPTKNLLPAPISLPADILRLKTQAFNANRRAKASRSHVRDAFYQIKNRAINALLAADFAVIDTVEWWLPDPVIGVAFAGGGKLHTKLSCLDFGALRTVLKQAMEAPRKIEPTQH